MVLRVNVPILTINVSLKKKDNFYRWYNNIQ
jgi:hypothetical protein